MSHRSVTSAAAQYFKNEHRRREDGRTGTADINNDNNNVFGNQSNNDEGAESDLDYDDPAVEDAAIMIQARFRGYRSVGLGVTKSHTHP